MNENRIKNRHLTSFVEVARHRSIGKAAAALAVSQPAVSKTIRELEEILGVELIDRSHRQIVLSAYGTVFLRFASASIEALRQGVESVELAVHDSLPTLRLGVSALAGRHLPAALARFAELGRGVTVRTIVAVDAILLAMLDRGEVDVVVAGLPTPPPVDRVVERLYDERLVAAVRSGHPLGAVRRGQPVLLAGRPIVVPPAEATEGLACERLLAVLGAGVSTGRIECASADLARRVVMSGDGVWIVGHGEVADDLASGRLIELPVETAATVPVGLMLRVGEEPTVTAGLFIDVLRQVVGEGRQAT